MAHELVLPGRHSKLFMNLFNHQSGYGSFVPRGYWPDTSRDTVCREYEFEIVDRVKPPEEFGQHTSWVSANGVVCDDDDDHDGVTCSDVWCDDWLRLLLLLWLVL